MHTRILELLKEAEARPKGKAKLAPLQQAEQLAGNDDEALFEIRSQLCTSYTLSGQPDQALIAFNWCLDKLDSDKARFGFNTPNILWQFKYVLEGLPQFTNITVSQIDDALDDYKKRLLAAGFSVRSYYYMKAQIDVTLGRLDEALDAFNEFVPLERDNQADCAACEIHVAASLAFDLGKWSYSLELAEPILTLRSHCASVPGRTLGFLSLAYLRIHDEANAKRCAEWGVGITRTNPTYLLSTASYIQALCRLKLYQEAVRTISHRIQWAEESVSSPRRLCFYLSCSYLMGVLIRINGDFDLKLPVSLPDLHSTKASYFRAWCDSLVSQLSTELDHRNGNRYWSQYVKTAWEW